MKPAAAQNVFAGSAVTVAGLGLFGGGAGAARWLARQGARVTITDRRSAQELAPALAELADCAFRAVFGGHDEADFERADLVVANPAMPARAPLLERARAAGVRVTSPLGLFLERSPAAWVGVTGTQGKSSTATFAAALAERAGPSGRRVFLGGNIGGSLLDLLELEPALGPADVVVIELSSYQLEALQVEGLAPAVGARAVAITNCLPDHLDRHGSMAAYRAAKLHAVELAAPDACVFVPADDAELAGCDCGPRRRVRFASEPPASLAAELAVQAGEFVWNGPGAARSVLGRTADCTAPGAFQRANALVALGLAHACGAPAQALTAEVGSLAAPAHRFEDLGLWAGRRVFDNAVSTTPDSTVSALRSTPDPCVLIAGGLDKGLDWSELARELGLRGAAAVTFGRDAELVARELGRFGARTQSAGALGGALRLAFARSAPGAALLFSPGCASFDAYKNFSERAADFRAELARAAAELGAPKAPGAPR